jgi:hypothetical protein
MARQNFWYVTINFVTLLYLKLQCSFEFSFVYVFCILIQGIMGSDSHSQISHFWHHEQTLLSGSTVFCLLQSVSHQHITHIHVQGFVER